MACSGVGVMPISPQFWFHQTFTGKMLDWLEEPG